MLSLFTKNVFDLPNIQHPKITARENMAGIRILMVEDDWIIAKEMALNLNDMGFETVGTFESGEEALQQIPELKPDLILVDIGLAGELTGIETAQRIKDLYGLPFIFLTALADAETINEAKITQPYAYLVKPVRSENLYSAIEITMHNARAQAITPTDKDSIDPIDTNLDYESSIFVKSRRRHQKIAIKDIWYVEAYDIYAQLTTPGGSFLISQSLKVVEERFPASHFMRVHRSYLVNLSKIEALEENELIIETKRIPIGKTFREALMNRLQFM
jgi:DNA-binding LytR/AlgR family response regulator